MSRPPANAGARWSRREFIAAAGAGAVAALLPRVGRAGGTDRVLVALFLRGAADGLNLCVPQADPDYYALRPNLQIPAGAALDLDGFFGLHPSLALLEPLWQRGELALVHAAGSPDPTRSHFDAQNLMERAVLGGQTFDGWLNRYLAATAGGRPIAGVRLGSTRDAMLAGSAPTLAISSITSFRLTGRRLAEREAALRARYGAGVGGALGRGMSEAFATLDQVGTVATETNVAYPTSPLGRMLRDTAALVKADIGVRVVAVDVGSWDTHSGESVRLAGLAADLAGSLAAFHADLGTDAERTLLLAMTEFGRTAAENAAGGTEHGHGGLMLCLGGGVAGGRVLLRDGVWPGLSPDDLWEGRDLQVTTDFRDVFAEVLERHLGVRRPGSLLPGHATDVSRYPGLFA